MSVSGCIGASVYLGGTDICKTRCLRSSFNKVPAHDQAANSMRVSHSTRPERSPALQLIEAAGSDLCMALAEADVFRVLSLWNWLDVSPRFRERTWVLMALLVVAIVTGSAENAAADDILVTKALPISFYDWTGFYLGGHLGYAGGGSSWSAKLDHGSDTQLLRLAEPASTVRPLQ